jgi:hypothetical protein
VNEMPSDDETDTSEGDQEKDGNSKKFVMKVEKFERGKGIQSNHLVAVENMSTQHRYVTFKKTHYNQYTFAVWYWHQISNGKIFP